MAGQLARPTGNQYNLPSLNPYERTPAAPPPSPLANQYKLYNSAVGQNAEDYGSIMSGYKNLLAKTQNSPVGQYTPQTAQYSPSADYTSAMGNMGELARTGGYSDQGIADLRARGVSPIRAVYAGANRDIDRNRALQGGFSPNYGALKAKMAREMSDKIGGATQDVNAGIAQNVAGNRASLASPYANAAQNESQFANSFGMKNADIMNDASKFNIGNAMTNNDFGLKALGGMQSLYGTTPAMSALFGGQASDLAKFQNQVQQQGSQNGLQMISQLMQNMPRA